MGRQKTLWIDEACWEKLEEMGDDSTSAKVRRAIMQHDVHHEAVVDNLTRMVAALRKQIKTLAKRLDDAGIEGWWTE